MRTKMKIYDKNYLPECINQGCGNRVHIRRYNKDKSIDPRSECDKCHNGGRNRPGVIAHKKEYCENQDGRLGFICKAEIKHSGQIDLDHKDGNRFNNVPENVGSFCKNCHVIKSMLNGDLKCNKDSMTIEEIDGTHQSPLEMCYTK